MYLISSKFMVNFQLNKRNLLNDAFQEIKETAGSDGYNNTDEMSPRSEDFAEDLNFRTTNNKLHL